MPATVRLFCAAYLLAAAIPAMAQTRVLTAADYARAEKFLTYNTTPLVFRSGVRPNWLAGDRFWYRMTTPEGSEFILADPERGTRAPAFNHAMLAAALSAAEGSTYEGSRLPFTEIDLSADGSTVSFNAAGKRYACDVQGSRCNAQGNARPTGGGRGGRGGRAGFAAGAGGGGRNESVSPDGKRAVFIRDYNLWVRDIATGDEKKLTIDGVKDFGYATDNAGWTMSDRPIVLWSPDSRKVATFQQDQRGVGEMYLVDTRVGHPALRSWKYPLPGDGVITTIQRVVIDVEAARVVRFQMPADQHRSSLCDDVVCRGGEWGDVQWSPDGSKLMFLSTSRDHKKESLRIADAATGVIREVFEESVPTFFESGNGRINWKYLPASNEFIWFS